LARRLDDSCLCHAYTSSESSRSASCGRPCATRRVSGSLNGCRRNCRRGGGGGSCLRVFAVLGSPLRTKSAPGSCYGLPDSPPPPAPNRSVCACEYAADGRPENAPTSLEGPDGPTTGCACGSRRPGPDRAPTDPACSSTHGPTCLADPACAVDRGPDRGSSGPVPTVDQTATLGPGSGPGSRSKHRPGSGGPTRLAEQQRGPGPARSVPTRSGLLAVEPPGPGGGPPRSGLARSRPVALGPGPETQTRSGPVPTGPGPRGGRSGPGPGGIDRPRTGRPGAGRPRVGPPSRAGP